MAYMAPEQLDWLTTSVNYLATDVWALGIIVFLLCTSGRFPWPHAHEGSKEFVRYRYGAFSAIPTYRYTVTI
jgi:serine/threonine protein kinase